jgi:arsenate reductase (glutaredoxin)
MITLYGIPNCDTVKRARAWLGAQGVDVRFHDFKRDGVPSAALERWLSAVGRERLVNRQGTTWRKLDDALKARADSDAGAQALMTEQASVIRRPVVEWTDGSITVGFDEKDWSARIGGRPG